jgi:hypothetical protein
LTKEGFYTLQYYSVRDVADRLGIPRDWILHNIALGRLPKRSFGKFRVLSEDDIPIVSALRAGEKPAKPYTGEHEVGITVELAAARAGVAIEFVRDLAEKGAIDAQRFGRSFIVFPTAIAQIEAAPTPVTRRDLSAYRTNTGNPKKISPLTPRYKTVIRMRLDDDASFAEIGRALGVTRERTSIMFANVLQRVALLQARGITEVADIAKQLDIDVETTTRLIALVQHAE